MEEWSKLFLEDSSDTFGVMCCIQYPRTIMLYVSENLSVILRVVLCVWIQSFCNKLFTERNFYPIF